MARSRRRSVRKYYKKRTKKRSFKKRYTKKMYTKKRYSKKRKYRRKKQRGGGWLEWITGKLSSETCKPLPFGNTTTGRDYGPPDTDKETWVDDWKKGHNNEDPTPEEMCIWGPDNFQKDCRWNSCASPIGVKNPQIGICTSDKGDKTSKYVYNKGKYCIWRQEGDTFQTVKDE